LEIAAGASPRRIGATGKERWWRLPLRAQRNQPVSSFESCQHLKGISVGGAIERDRYYRKRSCVVDLLEAHGLQALLRPACRQLVGVHGENAPSQTPRRGTNLCFIPKPREASGNQIVVRFSAKGEECLGRSVDMRH